MFPQINIEINYLQFDVDGYTKAVRLGVAKALREAARAFILEINNLVRIRTGFLRGAFGTLENVVGSVVGGQIVPARSPGIRKTKLGAKIASYKPPAARGVRRKAIEAKLPLGQKRAGATKILARQEVKIKKQKALLKKLQARYKRVANAPSVIRHQDQVFKTGEYYYPSPVGRKSQKKGNPRGILKTSSSGQQFATPSSTIFKATNYPLGWSFNYAVDIRYYGIQDVKWQSWSSAIDMFNNVFVSELGNLPDITQYMYTQKGKTAPTIPQFNMQGIFEQDIIANG